MNQKLIVIDGKTYRSVNEMPEEVRKNYEAALGNLDKNGNSTPDMLENVNAFFEDRNNDGMPDGFDGVITNAVTSTKIIADGREYNSMDELPPEVRAKLSQAMGKLDANQNGVPDFLEGMSNAPIQRTNVVSTFETDIPRRVSRTPVVAPTIEPESSSRWMIALAGLFILILCVAGAAGVWYFLFR